MTMQQHRTFFLPRSSRRLTTTSLAVATTLTLFMSACSSSEPDGAHAYADVDEPMTDPMALGAPAADEPEPLALDASDADAPMTVELAIGVAQMKLAVPQCTDSNIRWGGDDYYDVPIASDGSDNCWMDRGNESMAVLSLQRALVLCWNYDISIDADFGPQTQGALRDLQNRLAIAPDGVYGPETRAAMGPKFAHWLEHRCYLPDPRARH
jgi:hypothetical protein